MLNDNDGQSEDQSEDPSRRRNLTLGTNLGAFEMQPSVIEPRRSLDYHINIDGQLKAGISRAG